MPKRHEALYYILREGAIPDSEARQICQQLNDLCPRNTFADRIAGAFFRSFERRTAQLRQAMIVFEAENTSAALRARANEASPLDDGGEDMPPDA